MAFNEAKLRETLNQLPPKNRVAFAASCCERLLPNYAAFTLMEKWGDFDLLCHALDQVWLFLQEESLISKEELRQLIENCDLIIPDTEDFSSFWTATALDAAIAVSLSLESCLEPKPKSIAQVGYLVIQTLDGYLYWVNMSDTGPHIQDEGLTMMIDQLPLMVAELEKQKQDLERLTAPLTPELLDELRQSSSRMGIQPIKRGLIREAKK